MVITLNDSGQMDFHLQANPAQDLAVVQMCKYLCRLGVTRPSVRKGRCHANATECPGHKLLNAVMSEDLGRIRPRPRRSPLSPAMKMVNYTNGQNS